MPSLDAASGHEMNGATVAPEIIDAIRRYLSVETKRREDAIKALASTDRETDVRLMRLEAICAETLKESQKTTAITRSGRAAARTTALIAGTTAAGWIASHYDQLADVLRFLGRFFR